MTVGRKRVRSGSLGRSGPAEVAAPIPHHAAHAKHTAHSPTPRRRGRWAGWRDDVVDTEVNDGRSVRSRSLAPTG